MKSDKTPPPSDTAKNTRLTPPLVHAYVITWTAYTNSTVLVHMAVFIVSLGRRAINSCTHILRGRLLRLHIIEPVGDNRRECREGFDGSAEAFCGKNQGSSAKWEYPGASKSSSAIFAVRCPVARFTPSRRTLAFSAY
jgi:hypothetical protein